MERPRWSSSRWISLHGWRPWLGRPRPNQDADINHGIGRLWWLIYFGGIQGRTGQGKRCYCELRQGPAIQSPRMSTSGFRRSEHRGQSRARCHQCELLPAFSGCSPRQSWRVNCPAGHFLPDCDTQPTVPIARLDGVKRHSIGLHFK